MALGLSPSGLASRSARRPWITVGVWALTLVIAIALIAILIGDSLTADVGLTGEPESRRADALLRERFRVPGESTETEIILVSSRELTVDEAAFQEFVEKLYADFIGLGPGLVQDGTHYYLNDEERFVTFDRHTTGVLLTLVRGENLFDRRLGNCGSGGLENLFQVTPGLQDLSGCAHTILPIIGPPRASA